MEQPPATPPTIPQQAPAKKGMPALAWVGIGCGGLLAIGLAIGVYVFIVAKKKFDEFAANPEKAAAELMVSMNPDMEQISADDGKGTMTIRTKDGEEVTLSYKDIAEGKIVITDKEGNITRIGSSDLSQVPAWVPKAQDLTDGVSVFHSEVGGEIVGQFSGNTPRGAEELRSFFEDEASSLGLTSSTSSSMESGGTATITLGFSGGGKSLNIVITAKPGKATLVNTNYSEKK
jgi:hypothetical protein